jgi:hypothetical protein
MCAARSCVACSWLSWISLIPLFFAIRTLAPTRAAPYGALWGISFCWFHTVLVSSSISLSLFDVLLLTTVPAAYLSLGALLTRRFGFRSMILALGWVGLELALQPVGLTHGALLPDRGYGPLFDVAVSLLGYGTIAFLVAYVNALLLALVSSVQFGTAGCLSLDGSFEHEEYSASQMFVRPRFLTLCQRSPRAPPALPWS